MRLVLLESDLFTLTSSFLLKLGDVNCSFSKIFFVFSHFSVILSHSHSFAFILRFSGLHLAASEINIRKLLFLGRLITKPKVSVAVRTLFHSRTENFCNKMYDK